MNGSSSPNPNWDDLISERLDGLVDEVRWQQAIAEHGDELLDAYRMAKQLRETALSENPPAMPDLGPLRARMAAARVASNDQAVAPKPDDSTSSSPGWWTWVAACSAAVMAAAVFVPMILEDNQSTPRQETVAMADPETTASAQPPAVSMASEQLPTATWDAGVEIEMLSENSPSVEPLAGSGVAFGPDAETKPAAPVALTPTVPPSQPPVPPQESELTMDESTPQQKTVPPADSAAVEEDTLDALIAEAKAFTGQLNQNEGQNNEPE